VAENSSSVDQNIFSVDANTETSLELNSAFATPHSFLSHEWTIPDDLQLNFDDEAEGSTLHSMNTDPSNPEEDFGGTYLFPRTF
jgi:hypothetical protein